MRKIFAKISQIIITLLRGMIQIYQYTLSPDHGLLKKPFGHCRFYPSCSLYASEALKKHGLFRGLILSGKRLLRCNPFHAPSIDLVPDKD